MPPILYPPIMYPKDGSCGEYNKGDGIFAFFLDFVENWQGFYFGGSTLVAALIS